MSMPLEVGDLVQIELPQNRRRKAAPSSGWEDAPTGVIVTKRLMGVLCTDGIYEVLKCNGTIVKVFGWWLRKAV